MPMPILTLTSASNTSVTHTLPSVNCEDFLDVSFSSFLEETFVLKLDGTKTQGYNSSISTTNDQVLSRKNRTGYREIDVFDAERYFNERSNYSPRDSTKSLPSHQLKKDDFYEIFAIKEQSRMEKLSVGSDSSRRSKAELLHTIPRNQQARKTDKKSFLGSIRNRCSCSNKNSINFDDCTAKTCSNKSTTVRSRKSRKGEETSDRVIRKLSSGYNSVKVDKSELRVNSDGHFSLPVFTPKTGTQTPKIQVQEKKYSSVRKSVELFGSHIIESGRNGLNLQKKLTMLTWDAIAPGLENKEKAPSISSEMDDDTDSNASSDLFEIESLSKGNSFLSRQCMPESVIAGSAVDLSVISDPKVLGLTTTTTIVNPQKVGLKSKNGSLKEMYKWSSNVISGCKSLKAVRVAEDAYRPNDQGFFM